MIVGSLAAASSSRRERRVRTAGGGGEQLTARLQSDWAGISNGNDWTQLSDGGIWDLPSTSTLSDAAIIDAPGGIGWPCEKVCKFESGDSNFFCIIGTVSLGELAVGHARNIRWLIAYYLTDANDYNHHGTGDRQATGDSNWNGYYWGPGDDEHGAADPDRWGLSWAQLGSGNPNGVGQYGLWDSSQNWPAGGPLLRVRVYQFEIQTYRVDTTTYRFHSQIHDVIVSDTVPLYTDADFLDNVNRSTSLASNTLLNWHVVANSDGLYTGNNGLNGVYGAGVHHSDVGCWAIVDDLAEGVFIGKYGNVIGEVPV